MTEKEYTQKINERLKLIKETLIIKGKEYHVNGNPLHNFETAAKIKNETREEALDGMMIKQYVSYRDILNTLKTDKEVTEKYIREKMGDIINYFIISEIIMLDTIDNKFKDELIF